MTVRRARTGAPPLVGTASVPTDKSISHRAAILAAMADGTSRIRGYSPAGDCRSTLRVVRTLGATVTAHGGEVTVRGSALLQHGAGAGTVDAGDLDCGRSGTTMRLVAGAVAGAPMRARLTGDPQLLGRPMERVAEPLRLMGAAVETTGGRPPVIIQGGGLRGIRFRLPVASAQVKSAVLLAALRAEGTTIVEEPVPTRDHTERLLLAMGIRARVDPIPDGPGRSVTVGPGSLEPLDVTVRGDASSAAFVVAAAALVPGSDVIVERVGLNPTRTELLRVLRRAGGSLETVEDGTEHGEPVGSIRVRHASLGPLRVERDRVPWLVDEIPLVALLATQADGTTEVRGVGELRVKESDRIAGVVAGLRALGADAEELPDGFVVRGPTPLRGGHVDALADHRLAMTFAVAALIARGPVTVRGMEYADDSFPGFLPMLHSLARRGSG